MNLRKESQSYNILSLDLEMNQPSGKIIMVGACVGSLKTGEILETLRCYVKIDESISEYINKLTGISDNDLATKGISLMESYEKLKELMKKYDCDTVVLQWGDGDTKKLKNDLIAFGMDPKEWIFAYRYTDAKTLYQSYCKMNGMKLQSGLAKSMTKLGMKFYGTKHDGCDDAVNTFHIYYKLAQRFRNE